MPRACLLTGRAEQLRDEEPSAYKDIRAVARAQRDLVKIARVSRPVLNYKGPSVLSRPRTVVRLDPAGNAVRTGLKGPSTSDATHAATGWPERYGFPTFRL